FQAEDGIRDRTVTGVQTCALPISRRLLRDTGEVGGHRVGDVPARGILERAAEHPPRRIEQQESFLRPFEPREHARLFERLGCRRSEERRVGKEWGGGWAAGE